MTASVKKQWKIKNNFYFQFHVKRLKKYEFSPAVAKSVFKYFEATELKLRSSKRIVYHSKAQK